MEEPNLEIDFSSLDTNDSVSQEEKEAKILKILLTFEHGLKLLVKKKGSNTHNTLGPEAQLLLLLSLPTWNPTPLTLNALCRCIRLLYSLANLISIQKFVDKLLDWINSKEAISQQKKTALLDCLRAVIEVQGNKLYNYMQTIWTLCLKLIKNSNENTTTRYTATLLLISIIKSSNSSMDENVVKDIIKVCKSLLAMKAATFIVLGAECFEATLLYSKNIPTFYLNEELPILIKYFEDANFSVRRAISSLISTMIVGSQAANQKIIIMRPKKKLGVKPKIIDNEKEDINSIPTISNMLNSLSMLHCKPNTNESIRAGMFNCYITLFTKLGTSFIEGNYNEILKHIILELNPGSNYTAESPFDALVIRQRSNTLLREISHKILSEQGQVHAAKTIIELLNDWIKLMNDNEIKTPIATKSSIIIMIDELSYLIQDLGDASYSIQDIAIEVIINLLETQGYSIQISASWCLRNICSALPSFLPKLVIKFLEYLKNNFLDIMPLKISNIKKSMGYAYALGSLISVSTLAPQSIMNKLYTSIFTIASQLLKSESNMSFIIADTNIFQSQNAKIQVGWILIGSLMCIGPNYVRLILPQIILLFKTYLAKSSIKLSFYDVSNQMLTLSITHSREYALQALYLFIVYNEKELVKEDVIQRILPLLNNSLLFYKDSINFIAEINEKDKQDYTVNIRKLIESINMIRKRTLQCYALINPLTFENHFTLLSKNILELLTITSKTSNAISIWTDEDVVADWTGWTGNGYTMTNHFHRKNNAIEYWKKDNNLFQDENHHLFDSIKYINQFDIDKQLLYPKFGAREFDPISLYLNYKYINNIPNYFNSMTSTVISIHDVAIDLFSNIFLHLIPRVQTSLLEKIVHSIKNKSDLWNLYSLSHCLFAILGALKVIVNSNNNNKLLSLSNKSIIQIEEIIKMGLECNDDDIRKLSSELLGYLSKNLDNKFINKHIKQLVDNIINYNDSNIRVGSLLGLSSIYRNTGSLIGNNHLPSVIQVMRTLSNDIHPLVHNHSLEALSIIINSIGHTFYPYIIDTLYIVFRLFLSESHQPGGIAYSNTLLIDHFLIRQNCGKVLNSIINVLGPEIITNKACQFLCYSILEQLKNDNEDIVIIQYLQSINLLIMFDYSNIDLEFLIHFLLSKLKSIDPQLKRIAANCLYQLIQKSLNDVLKYAGNNIYEQLFQLLDNENELNEIIIILNKLLLSSNNNNNIKELLKWIDIIKSILTKHNIENIGSFNYQNTNEDEEDNSLNPKAISDIKSKHINKNSRWRTQLVALQLLSKVLEIIKNNSKSNQMDNELILKFNDLVKLAFAAATTPIENISIEGYNILKELIILFKQVKDPQFSKNNLLDQYQSQITAALAPAFNDDVSYEVTAKAIDVCSIFIMSFNSNSNSKSMNRIFKLMENTLIQCCNNDNSNNNNNILINLTILKSWSQIILNNNNNEQIDNIINTNLEILCKLWIKCLADYTYIKLDPKLLSMTDKLDNNNNNNLRISFGLNFINNSTSRNWLLPLYQQYWMDYLKVINFYLYQQHPIILNYFIYKDKINNNFWIIFGLCMESLSSSKLVSNNLISTQEMIIIIFNSIKYLFNVNITGQNGIDKVVFKEMLIVFERFKYTNNFKIILELVYTIRSIIINYDSSYFFDLDNSEGLKEDNNIVLSNTLGFIILKYLIGLLLTILKNYNLSKNLSNSNEKLELEIIYEINSSIYELILKSPINFKSNLSIILINLIKKILIEINLKSFNDKLILILKNSILNVDSEEAISSILNYFIQNYLKFRDQKDDDKSYILYNCLVSYTNLIINLPKSIDEKSIQILNYSLIHAFKSDNQQAINSAIKSTLLLIENINSEQDKVNQIAMYCIKRSLLSYIKSFDNYLNQSEFKIKMIEDISNIFIELYSKIEIEKERCLIGNLLITILTNSSSYNQLIPIICKNLSNFAAKFPNEFKVIVANMDLELRKKLEMILKSNTLIDNNNINQNDDVDEFNDFNDNNNKFEDEDEDDYFDEDYDEDEDDEFGNFDDGFNSDNNEDFDDPKQPTIQLKDSFF